MACRQVGAKPLSETILLIRTLGTNFSEILGKIHSFSFKKMHLKMSSAKGRLFSLGLNELKNAICLFLGKSYLVNTLRPRQNSRHFADDVMKCIFLKEKKSVSINISLNFVPKGQINNISALVQIMAWHLAGAKPLSEPMMVSLLTYICVTRHQWVNIWNNLSICMCTNMSQNYAYVDHIHASLSDWSSNALKLRSIW